jgi:thioredoxin 1
VQTDYITNREGGAFPGLEETTGSPLQLGGVWMGTVQAVEASGWDQAVLQAKEPVLVDFWAVWCGPCRMLAPTVEEIAGEYAGRLKVFKLNTDDNQEIASRYQIMGIPTLLFFKDGNVVDKVVGVVPKRQIKERVDAILT